MPVCYLQVANRCLVAAATTNIAAVVVANAFNRHLAGFAGSDQNSLISKDFCRHLPKNLILLILGDWF
jgi:hypothetical protein